MISIHLRAAGLICFTWVDRYEERNLHLLVRRSHWQWGYTYCEWDYDGPAKYLGLGPLFLAVWRPKE